MRLAVELPLPAGYRAAEVLAYHGRDALSLSERVVGRRIVKPVRLAGGATLVAIDLGAGDHAALHADRALDRGETVELTCIAERMLGFGSDVDGFERLAAGDPQQASLASPRPGLRIPLTANPWEGVCWAVIGQQINLTFAAALRRTLVELAGTPRGDGEWRLHPDSAEVAALEPEALTARRFSRSKASYLIGLARLVADGLLDLDGLGAMPADAAEAALVALRGVGPWTARYILLRGFGFPDIAPVGDSGLATGLQRLLALPERPDIAAQEAAMAAFSPYRSLATAHLWASLTSSPSPRPQPLRLPAATG